MHIRVYTYLNILKRYKIYNKKISIFLHNYYSEKINSFFYVCFGGMMHIAKRIGFKAT